MFTLEYLESARNWTPEEIDRMTEEELLYMLGARHIQFMSETDYLFVLDYIENNHKKFAKKYKIILSNVRKKILSELDKMQL